MADQRTDETPDWPEDSLSGREARKRLHALSEENLSRNQALERVLAIGVSYLGVDRAHIADIDRESGRREVTVSTDGPDGAFPVGHTADLDETYCRETIRREDPLVLHDAKNQGWADDIAYQQTEIETYLGVRIEVYGEAFGTLCFLADDPRPDPFSEPEVIFVELAGQVLERILERNHHEREITNRDRLIGILNRVLRHNLRNDLNVVQGNAHSIQKRHSGETARLASVIKSTAADLLEIGEKARRLERLTASPAVVRSIDVVEQVRAAVEQVVEDYPDATVRVETPDAAMALGSPHLERAVVELVENALEHSGESPSVDVRVELHGSTTRVVVADDGPGLPAEERQVLVSGKETPLEHGSGLGLILVHWIVVNLEGELDVDVTPPGTTVTIALESAE